MSRPPRPSPDARLSPRRKRELARREERAGARLPFAQHVDDATIASRDGQLYQVIHVQGLAFETADTETLNYRKQVRDAALRAISGSRLAIHHHIVRREVRPELAGRFSNGFAHALDAAWRRRLEGRRLFVNDLFFTLTRTAPRGRLGWLESLMGAAAPQDAAGRARDRRDLDAARESLISALDAYGPRLLTTYQGDEDLCSEPLEFFALLYNGDYRPVPVTPGDQAGLTLTDKRVSFGVNALELSEAGDDAVTFAAMLSLKEYPPFTEAGQLDALLRQPREMVVTQSFAAVDRQAGLDRIELAIRRMRAADDDAVSLRRQLVQAKDDLAAARQSFGEHHLSVMVKAASLDALDQAVAETSAAFTEMGAIAVREEVAMEPAFWAQFPGNLSYAPRKALISSGNFASLASAHNHPLGKADGNLWGPAVSLLETTAASPYYFNFHRGDLGNFIVIGPSGAGKTVALSFLLAQAQKFQPRLFFFDKDRGAEIFLRAMGATYAVLRPGVASGFNPLMLPDTPVNRRFLMSWTAKLVALPGETLGPEDQAQIADAVAANFDQRLELRRLRYFRELFVGARRPSAGDLAARLGPWVNEGDRAWLFDNPTDQLDLANRSLGYDMTALLDDPVTRTPAMMYLFHRVEERLDGEPSIIVVDEGWKALDDDIFVARIRDWEKTIRKRNGIVGFATQSAQDALDSRIASAIIEQSAVQIFLPNPKAREKDYCQGFGLSPHEFDLIRTLPDTSRCMLVKAGRDSVVVRLNLNGLTDVLTVLSGRERTVRLLDEIRADVGDDPAAWLSRLVAAAR
jgi:type IV secretion system protein VirB4